MKTTKDVKYSLRWLMREYTEIIKLHDYIVKLQGKKDFSNKCVPFLKQTMGTFQAVVAKERKMYKSIRQVLKHIQREKKKILNDNDFKDVLGDAESTLKQSIEVSLAKSLVALKTIQGELAWINNPKDPRRNDNMVVAMTHKIEDDLEIFSQVITELIASLKRVAKLYTPKSMDELTSPETKETKSAKELRTRRKDLKHLGLKGKNKITSDKADIYFVHHFGILYSQLLHAFGIKELEKIKEHILRYTNKKKHAILFPLTGSLFNYYVAKGFAIEMKRLKQAKYLKLLTIQSSFKENDEKKLKLEFLERQIKLILSKNHLSTISVIDNVAQGRTIKGLGLAFNKFGVKLIGNQIVISKQSMDFFNKYKTEFGTYESFMEHQTIQENKITPHSLSHKFFPGTSVPLSHAKRVAQEQILKKEINQSAKIGYIKELFTTFGRTYYRLSVLKDNS